jgi:hypothetical protein
LSNLNSIGLRTGIGWAFSLAFDVYLFIYKPGEPSSSLYLYLIYGEPSGFSPRAFKINYASLLTIDSDSFVTGFLRLKVISGESSFV